jgi:hypothetical protein
MRVPALSLAIGLVSSVSLAQSAGVPLSNWTVPAYRSSSASGGLTTMAEVTPGIAFVAIQPCRVADTRGNGAPIQGGIFANSEARNWLITGKCGIPAGTDAVSANFSVVSVGATPTGAFLLAWPTGQPAPPTAIMTYGPGVTVISNAAVVPLNASGQMTVNVSHSTHVILDVNGYFTDQYNPGVSFHAVSSTAAPAILAENTSQAVAGAFAIQAVVTSNLAGGSSAAVRGIHNNSSNNNGIGVWGSHAGAGWGVLGTSQTGFGTVGQIFGNIGIGVFGQMAGNTCIICRSAGVYGVDGGGGVAAVRDSVGVRGESRFHIGVLGISEAFFDGAGLGGIRGELTDSAGNQLVAGVLGFKGTTNYGVYAYGGYGSGGAVYSVDPHPQDASKVIRYVSLEGNESGTYFRGRGRFQNGIATIDVPEDFRLVTDPEDLTVQVTPIGQMASVGVVKIGLDRIVVRGSRDVEFSYMVNGVRKSHKHLTPIGPGAEFMPESADTRMPLYLTEGQRQMLISNGTYRPDGTVNRETARRLGWDKEWEKRNRPAPQPATD